METSHNLVITSSMNTKLLTISETSDQMAKFTNIHISERFRQQQSQHCQACDIN